MELKCESVQFDSGADYTLEIDFNVLNVIEMKSVLKILYNSSSFCYGDIYLLGENVIERMDYIGLRLRDRENRCLAELVVETFNILKKINRQPVYISHSTTQQKKENPILVEMHDKFNHYMYSALVDSPVASPVKSPCAKASPAIDTLVEKVRVPKKMKKAFRR
tara:strand:- start:641 stop:1132 length:492 start_codon:yes stop_codon:yes gene_type:complete